MGKLFHFCYLCFYVCRWLLGESFSERPAMCPACKWVACTRHPRELLQAVGRIQWTVSITNQHPEKAARWAFWIICGPKRQLAANQSDQRLTEGKVCTPFCCYTIFWLRNNMTFYLINNKIIMISSRWYQGFCMCNYFKRMEVHKSTVMVNITVAAISKNIIILLLFLNITVTFVTNITNY